MSITNYIITEKTLLLAPHFTGSKTFTNVIEREGTVVVSKKPIHIISRSCIYYGSDLETTLNISKLVLGDNRKKSPIILVTSYGIPYIFIPILSPHSDLNVWISYHAIDSFGTDGLGTSVFLENGHRYKLDVSLPTLYRQYALARLLEKDYINKRQQFNRAFPQRPITDGPTGYPDL